MERQIAWIKSLLDGTMLEQEERLNCSIYLTALQTPGITEHEGRYLLIRNGVIYPQSFCTPQDTFFDDLDEDKDNKYSIFYIPTKTGDWGATM